MAVELSSNWKKLQAKIQGEGSKPAVKRKAAEADNDKRGNLLRKKQKVQQEAHQKLPQKPQQKPQPWPQQKSQATGPLSKSGGNRRQDAIRVGSVVEETRKNMGGTQASKLEKESKTTISPSLALWADDNDVSLEDIAQAYGLGVSGRGSLVSAAESRPNEGLASGVEVGKYVAMDCEMVGVGEGGHESALARVSLVDFHGRQVYDSFVLPREPVTDWRTAVSGVSPKDMRTARAFDMVQAQVADLLRGGRGQGQHRGGRGGQDSQGGQSGQVSQSGQVGQVGQGGQAGQGRILVGHDLRHDLLALLLDHPASLIRDTALFSGFRKHGHGRKPALRVLARELLGIDIHQAAHSSIEDARVAMLLFRRHKPAFDVAHAAHFPDAAPAQLQRPKAKAKSKAKGRKKKRKN